VILDATLIRLVLLPAAVRLAGERAWRTPRWLDRIARPRRARSAPDDSTATPGDLDLGVNGAASERKFAKRAQPVAD